MDSMSPKEFVKQVLMVTRENLPELYDQKIKGRRLHLIAEYAPSESGVSGQRIFRVNRDLRLLFALGKMFGELSKERSLDLREVHGVSKACQCTQGMALYALGCSCNAAFWEIIKSRLNTPRHRDYLLSLQPDWAILRVALESVPQEERPSQLREHLSMINDHALIVHLAEYAEKCIDRLS